MEERKRKKKGIPFFVYENIFVYFYLKPSKQTSKKKVRNVLCLENHRKLIISAGISFHLWSFNVNPLKNHMYIEKSFKEKRNFLC